MFIFATCTVSADSKLDKSFSSITPILTIELPLWLFGPFTFVYVFRYFTVHYSSPDGALGPACVCRCVYVRSHDFWTK